MFFSFFFLPFIDETRWGKLRLLRLHWAYLHSCVMMWMILAALWIRQFYIYALKDWLERPLWESQSLEALHPENRSQSRDVRLRLVFLLSPQRRHSSHPVKRGGLFDLCEIRFLLQKCSIYCPLHAVFSSLSWLPERIVASFVSLSEGVKNCAVQIIASVPIWCSHICCISTLLRTLVRCQLLVLFMNALFFFPRAGS